jgi:outer membrane protein assembly factor BamB
MRFIRHAFVLIAVVVGCVSALHGQGGATDVTQWRGPARDGSATLSVPAAWPERFTQKWKVDVGLGYATPLVAGNRVYVFSRQGENEVMSALDADSGKVLWHTDYPAPFTVMSAAAPHGPGPKSTPVLSNGRLYAIGMTGVVSSYDAASGKLLWQKPGSSVVPMYTSHSFSPLVDNGLVIFHVGGHNQGALTAFDLYTGEAKWTWTGDGPGYGSPIVVTLGGTRQLVTITQGKLVGVDVANGALLWERPLVSANFTNSITPVMVGQTLVVSANLGPMLGLNVMKRNNQWVAETAWENPDLPERFSNPVVIGDTIYGLSTKNAGQYFAVDGKTGKTLWTSEGRQANNAALVKAGNVLFSLENDGELVVIRPNPTAFEVVRRYKVADTDTWTQPAMSGNRIFIKDISTLTLWTLS